MKVINKAFIAFAIMGLSSTTARADLYNVQFSNTVFDLHAAQYTGQGVEIGTAKDYWNLFTAASVSSQTLYNAENVLSSSAISFTSDSNNRVSVLDNTFTGTNGIAGGGYNNLTSGYISTLDSSTFSFGGLDKTGKTQYTLYLYTQGDKYSTDESLAITQTAGSGVSGTVSTASSVANTTNFVQGQNWEKFTVTPDATGKVSFTYAPGFYNGQNQGLINGLQLTSNAPEPSTLVLLGIGGVMLVAFKLKSDGIISAFSA